MGAKNLLDTGVDSAVGAFMPKLKLPNAPTTPTSVAPTMPQKQLTIGTGPNAASIQNPQFSQQMQQYKMDLAKHNNTWKNYNSNVNQHQQQVKQLQQQHQNKQDNRRQQVDKAVAPLKSYMGVAPTTGRGGNVPWQQLDKAIRSTPMGNVLIGPNKHKASLSTQVAQKAVSLLPYINDSYTTETNKTKLLLAFNAAYEFLNNEKYNIETQKKSPGGGGEKKTVNAKYIFDKVKPEAWLSWIQSLALENPSFVKIACNGNKSLVIAKKMAYGNYNGQKGPQFEAPLSLFGRLPQDTDKVHDKLQPYFNNYTNKAAIFIKQLGINAVESLKEIPTKKALLIPAPNIPLEKQHQIDQIANQLNSVHDDNGTMMLLEQLHRVTSHLNDLQRKQLIPESMYELYNNMILGFKNRDKIDAYTDFNCNSVKNDLKEVTADLTQDEFELSLEAFLDLGYSEDTIMQEAERRFAK